MFARRQDHQTHTQHPPSHTHTCKYLHTYGGREMPSITILCVLITNRWSVDYSCFSCWHSAKQGSRLVLTSLSWFFMNLLPGPLMSTLHTRSLADTHTKTHKHIMLRHAPSVCALFFIQPAARTEFHQGGKKHKNKGNRVLKAECAHKSTNSSPTLVNFQFAQLWQRACLPSLNKQAKN